MTKGKIALAAIILFCSLVMFIYIKKIPGMEARKSVYRFYSYEERSDFGASWNYFYPTMHQKFDKINYIQKRASFYKNFGTDGFKFYIKRTKRLTHWTMSKGTKPLPVVYRFLVIQNIKGTYGNLSIHKYVYTAKYNGRWRILWDFN